MKNEKLAKALRDVAANIDGELENNRQDVAELVRVLARIVAGKSLEKAFGAPGDWGYNTRIGDGVFAMLNEAEPHGRRCIVKPNENRHWIITLYGAPEAGKKRIEQIECTGDIQAALDRADELESCVDFDVLQFVITRGALVKAKKGGAK